MKDIESAVVAQDKNIKSMATRVKKALRETVELDSLSVKVLTKYQKFLQHRVNLRIEESKLNGQSQGQPADDPDDGMAGIGSIMTGGYDTRKNMGATGKAEQPRIFTTLQSKYYDIERQSSVYYLHPGSSNIQMYHPAKE